ncbi:hypothetical protein P4B35_17535 [Pontiellaceae bacterium B12227]|nr:hypothetical protein [Pontiellaceae bacterium B12227]
MNICSRYRSTHCVWHLEWRFDSANKEHQKELDKGQHGRVSCGNMEVPSWMSKWRTEMSYMSITTMIDEDIKKYDTSNFEPVMEFRTKKYDAEIEKLKKSAEVDARKSAMEQSKSMLDDI